METAENTRPEDFSFADIPSGEVIISNHPDRRILFSFDFDGTLVDLVSRAELVQFDGALREAVEIIAQKRGLVICSGRAIKDLRKYISTGSDVDLIGNHGSEWLLQKDGKNEIREFTPDQWVRWREEIFPGIENLVKRHGGNLEDKQHSISIHYRTSGTRWWSSPEALNALLGMTTREQNARARLIPGVTCWNVVPVGMSKGFSLISYAQHFKYDMIVYFGDEATDESVFEQNTIPIIGIKVGSGPTAARYRLGSVHDVQKWIIQLSMVDSGLT